MNDDMLRAIKDMLPKPEQEKQRPVECKCPECGDRALIWRVKEGRNKGRPMLFCQSPLCKGQKWMDLPSCDFCGEEMYEHTIRGGKKKGRRFYKCPNNCRL